MVSESQADSLVLSLSTSVPSPNPASNLRGSSPFEGGDKESGTKLGAYLGAWWGLDHLTAISPG